MLHSASQGEVRVSEWHGDHLYGQMTMVSGWHTPDPGHVSAWPAWSGWSPLTGQHNSSPSGEGGVAVWSGCDLGVAGNCRYLEHVSLDHIRLSELSEIFY